MNQLKGLGSLFKRGTASSNQRDLEREIAECNKAIQLNPRNAVAYYNRGNAYKSKGNLDQAISDYTKGARKNNFRFSKE